MNISVEDVHKFISFATKDLKLTKLPRIKLVGSEENSKDAFGHFVGNDITVRITDRHPIDVMRTLAHELIHWKQRLSGKKESESKKEDEANEFAGRIMRDFDVAHPEVFNDPAMKANMMEDDGGSVGVTSILPANRTGNGIMGYDPILNPGKKQIKRTSIGMSYDELGKDTSFQKSSEGKPLRTIIPKTDPVGAHLKRLKKGR